MQKTTKKREKRWNSLATFGIVLFDRQYISQMYTAGAFTLL